MIFHSCWRGQSKVWLLFTNTHTHAVFPSFFRVIFDDANHTHTLPAYKSCRHMYRSHKSTMASSLLAHGWSSAANRFVAVISIDWWLAKIVGHTWDAGSFYERDMAAMSPQQRARWAERHKETHRLRNDEAREKKQSVNQGSIRRESRTRVDRLRVKRKREALKENHHDQHLLFVGPIHEINQ